MVAIASSSCISLAQILIATDLSDASINAIHYASTLAKRYSSHVMLAHICQPGESDRTGDYFDRKAEERLEMLRARLWSQGVPTLTTCRYGPVESEVLWLAAAYQADLLVLGTRGRTGLKRLLLGSKAETITSRSDRPVLLVGPAATPHPRTTWAPKKIFCATNLNLYSIGAAVYGCQLAKDNEAAFTLFYVESPRRHPAPELWHAFENAFDEALPEGEMRRLSLQKFSSTGDPAMSIVALASVRQADLIILSTKHSSLGSTHLSRSMLARVLAAAPCPVLAVPRSEKPLGFHPFVSGIYALRDCDKSPTCS